MHNEFVNRRKLRFIKTLVALLLIVLSLSAITFGILLINSSQKKAREAQPIDYGESVARVGNFEITNKQFAVPADQTRQLPLLIAATEPLSDGVRISGQGIEFTTSLLQELGKNKVAVDTATIYTRDYSFLTLPGNIRVIYKEKSSPSELASSLQSMLSVFTIEGRKPTEIDFRFEKPVVRY